LQACEDPEKDGEYGAAHGGQHTQPHRGNRDYTHRYGIESQMVEPPQAHAGEE